MPLCASAFRTGAVGALCGCSSVYNSIGEAYRYLCSMACTSVSLWCRAFLLRHKCVTRATHAYVRRTCHEFWRTELMPKALRLCLFLPMQHQPSVLPLMHVNVCILPLIYLIAARVSLAGTAATIPVPTYHSTYRKQQVPTFAVHTDHPGWVSTMAKLEAQA